MTIKINGTPIDYLAQAPNILGVEKIPTGRAWSLLRNNRTN